MTLIVIACQPGWEEMENLRGSWRKWIAREREREYAKNGVFVSKWVRNGPNKA